MCPGTSTPKACPGVRSSTIGSKKMRWRCSMTANQQGCGLSAPDITIVNSEAADRFSWQPLNELSSDHSPILIKWNQLVKTERAQRRVRPNFQKVDWNVFRARLAEYQPLLEAVTDPATKLKTFVDCVQKATAIVVPQKVCRKKETPWMNAELKTLIQERNRLR